MISFRKISLSLSGVVFLFLSTASAEEIESQTKTTLVEDAKPVVSIVIERGGPELTHKAAEKLVYYIKEISGAELPLLYTSSEVKTPGILWVGSHQELEKRYPNLNLSVEGDEETLIKTIGSDLVVLGRDIVASDGMQLQAGTHLAVSSLIEDHLGVRWLWPGKYGTDIPKTSTIRLPSLDLRYQPQLHFRDTNWTTFFRSYKSLSRENVDYLSSFIDSPKKWANEKDQLVREWVNHHRADSRPTGQEMTSLAGSLWNYSRGHAFRTWYEKYGAEHPEWFALQPDGTRTPFPSEKDVKMCISNPEVAEQWVQNAKQYFEENPHAFSFAAGEDDYGWKGYCVCENCLAWDNQEAEILEHSLEWKDEKKPHYALTDRYAKFWNIVAKRLKEEFPDRKVMVSPYAYQANRPAPSFSLEENMMPAFIGIQRRFYEKNKEEYVLDHYRIWKEWWEALGKRNALVWRPNTLIREIGLPYIFTERYEKDMHFMADHGLVGVTFDSGVGKHWATLGPQLYLMMKMMWDPKANANEILQDYYERAFGPAAPYIEEYYQRFEDLYARVIAKGYDQFNFWVYSDPPRIYREMPMNDQPASAPLGQEGVKRNNEVEKTAKALLEKASKAVAEGDAIYRDRVEFVKLGFDFIQAQLDTIEAVNDYQKDKSEEALKRAVAAAQRRSEVLKAQAGTFAINEIQVLGEIQRRPTVFAPPVQK